MLHEYYITRRCKSKIYKVQILGDAHEIQKEISRASQEETGKEDLLWICLLHKKNMVFSGKGPLWSKLQNLEMQVQA